MARVKSPSHILKKIYNRVSVSPFVVKLFPAMLLDLPDYYAFFFGPANLINLYLKY